MGQTNSSADDVITSNIYSLGNNKYGELGYSTDEKDHLHLLHRIIVPEAPTSSEFLSASCGLHHCALISRSGDLFTWGLSTDGQLGHGTAILGGSSEYENSDVRSVEHDKPGDKHTKSTRSFSSVDWSCTPRLVKELSGHIIKQVSCGNRHTLALTSEGSVYSWGHGGNGRLGHGADISVSRPLKISALEPYIVEVISGGGMHSMCMTSVPIGWVFSWGLGSSGQLGQGDDLTDRFVPSLMPSLFPSDNPLLGTSTGTGVGTDHPSNELRVIQVACGSLHSAALLNSGAVLTWGSGAEGQLGHGDALLNSNCPKTVNIECPKTIRTEGPRVVDCGAVGQEGEAPSSMDVRIVKIALGHKHTAVVTQTGDLYVWGVTNLIISPSGNQISSVPVLVDRSLFGNEDCIAVFCGSGWTASITRSSDVYIWGSESITTLLVRESDISQKMLVQSINRRPVGFPIKIEGLSNQKIVSIGAGKSHLIAVANVDLFRSMINQFSKVNEIRNTKINEIGVKSDSSSFCNLSLPPAAASLLSKSMIDDPKYDHSNKSLNNSASGDISAELKELEISRSFFRLLFPTFHFHPELVPSLVQLGGPVVRQAQIVSAVKEQISTTDESFSLSQNYEKSKDELLVLLKPPITPTEETNSALDCTAQTERILSVISAELCLHQRFTMNLLRAIGTSDSLLAAAVDECKRLREKEQSSQKEIQRLQLQLESVQKIAESSMAEAAKRFAEKELRWRNTVEHLKRSVDMKT